MSLQKLASFPGLLCGAHRGLLLVVEFFVEFQGKVDRCIMSFIHFVMLLVVTLCILSVSEFPERNRSLVLGLW